MGYFLTYFIVIFVFLFGSLLGVLLTEEHYMNKSHQPLQGGMDSHVCDACDSQIDEDDALFCENCFEDDDKLTTAIKEKELEIRYINVALRGRNLVNKPSRSELEKLRRDTDRVMTMCDNVQVISNDLNLKIDLAPLRERNTSLRTCISKWETINDREEKIDTLLNTGKSLDDGENKNATSIELPKFSLWVQDDEEATEQTG